MAFAELGSTADWTLFWVLVVIAGVLSLLFGTVYLGRDGHLGLFKGINGIDELIFALALFVGVIIVVAPLYGLWVAGRALVHRFAPEMRQAHAEAVQQRRGKKNAYVDLDRQKRRQAAAKLRANRQAAVQPPDTNPSGAPVVRD